MKRYFIYTALLLTIVAQSAWAVDNYTPRTYADKNHGPWTFDAAKTGRYTQTTYTDLSFSFSGLNQGAWARHDDEDDDERIAYLWNHNDGIGFSMHCNSMTKDNQTTKYGIFSTYKHDEVVPSYTRKRLTWNYTVAGKTNRHSQCVVLYACDNMSTLKDAKVDFTAYYSGKTDSPYYIAKKVTGNDPTSPTEKEERTDTLTRTFDFDNRTGSTEQTKSWNLLLTIVAAGGNGWYSCHQWGCFRSESETWETFYYKYITFNANGGTGSMSKDTIENSGILPANTFTREHYTFAGWATSANGAVAYADGAEITATLSSKGPVTLYAVWNQVDYNLSYELNGGTASNPTTYTVETPTFTLNNPTRDGYTFVGWTGSNGEELQTTVTITVGSYGDKSYTAHWERTIVFDTKELIAAIGVVTMESKEAIDAARASYSALTAEEKTLITAAELETLQKAEATYAALGKTTINFVSRDAATLINTKKVALYYPAAPEVYGFTFRYWQPVAEDITDGKILIQAVYE